MQVIQRITIIGVGLIGGSFGLALKKIDWKGTVVGCDSLQALEAAIDRKAIDRAEPEVERSVEGSDLVLLAAPVLANLDLLRRVSAANSRALVTDVSSTKVQIANLAAELFGEHVNERFVPAHPIAGKETQGIADADAGLCRGASWVLTPHGGRRAMVSPAFCNPAHREYFELLEQIGANIVVCTAEEHDRLMSLTSHLPQLVSSVLAATVLEKAGDNPLRPALSGSGLRDTTRLSRSDARLWKDITATNRQNIVEALRAFQANAAALAEAIEGGDDKAFLDLFERGRDFDITTVLEKQDDFDPPKF